MSLSVMPVWNTFCSGWRQTVEVRILCVLHRVHSPSRGLSLHTQSSSISSSAPTHRAFYLCWASSDMSLPLISVLLLLQPLQMACEMKLFTCHGDWKPSVYKDGDLVLGGFFPLLTMEENKTVSQLHFLMKSPQEVSRPL